MTTFITIGKSAVSDVMQMLGIRKRRCLCCKCKITSRNLGILHRDYIICDSFICLMKFADDKPDEWKKLTEDMDRQERKKIKKRRQKR